MASKKKAAPPDLSMVELDSVMDGVMQQQALEHGSRTIDADFSNHTLVIPVPGLCLEWMLGINGCPLSRTWGLAAEPHVGKTAFLTEMVRWHRALGGRGAVGCTEGDKDSPTLRLSILNQDFKALEYRPFDYLEAWNVYLTQTAKRLIKLFASDPRYTVPVCMGADSLVGVLCKGKVDSIWETGHAKADYATEAKLLGDWIRTFATKGLAGNPFSFVGTSHIYLQQAARPGMPPKIIVSGGQKILYMSAITILMRHVEKIDTVNLKGQIVNFSLLKNTLAGTKQFHRFDCGLYWYHMPDGQQVTWWDWDEATVWLLSDRNRFPVKGELGSKVVEVCNIHSASGGKYWSKQLGVKEGDAMSASELGKIFHANATVVDQMRTVLSIQKHPYFKSHVKYEPVQLAAAADEHITEDGEVIALAEDEKDAP